MQDQYATLEKVRGFLTLCLDPGYGVKRSPEKLAEVMPDPLAGKVAEFAPHLGELRHAAQALDEQARQAGRAYADALAAWVRGEEPNRPPATLASKCFDCSHTLNWHTSSKGPCRLGECACDRFQGERYVVGRSGVFATLYDWQEHRLVVANATEEHCRRARDHLLATEGRLCATCDAPAVDHLTWGCDHQYVEPADSTPAPAVRRSMPLLEAVTVAHEAAVAHAVRCGICWPGMRFAEMCGDGRREALASLDQVHGEPECAHLAWEVTSEHRNDQGMWVKSRKCADCTERLNPVVEREPHWPESATGGG